MNIREGILLGSFLVAGFLNPANATPVPVTFFTYTLENGVYEPSGIPITGTITVAAPSDTVTSADLITNLGTFSIILGQQIDGSGYDLSLENTAGTFEINLNLSSASSLFSGVGTTINTDLSDIVPIPGRAIGVPSGTFAISAVPEPSTWAMMVLGFLGVGFPVGTRWRLTLPKTSSTDYGKAAFGRSFCLPDRHRSPRKLPAWMRCSTSWASCYRGPTI